MKKALLVIDVQNEYFGSAGGGFPQANADETAARVADYIQKAQAEGQLIVNIQHFAAEGAPIFQRGTPNVDLHRSVAALLADKPRVEKAHADSFLNTNLTALLTEHGITDIDICGMMTQNCVTHTALSPFADAYKVRVLTDLCTAPSELVHLLALNAIKDRSIELV